VNALLLALAIVAADKAPVLVGGADGASTNRAALQAAIDDTPPSGSVVVPAGQWWLDRPLWLDRPAVELRGERGATLRFPGSCGVVIGIPRVPLGQALPARTVFDATDRHDGSCGRRLGLHLSGGVHLASGGGPFQHGQRGWWKGATKLTLDWMFDTSDWPEGAGAHVGMSERGVGAPLYATLNHLARLGGRNLRFDLGAVDRGGATRTVGWQYDLKLTPGVHRLAFQVDLAAARAACWLDGATLANPALPWKASDGLAFAANRRVPLLANALGPTSNFAGSDYAELAPVEAQTLLGLAFADDLRYAWTPTLARLDGAAITDQMTYFTDWAPVVACLPLDDDPALVLADRRLRVRQGGPNYGDGDALLLSPAHGDPSSAVGMPVVRNLAIRAAGDAILTGYALYPTIEDCDLQGSAGIGSWNWGANYLGHVRRCWLLGSDAAFYAWYGMWDLDDVHAEAVPRVGLWATQGSRVRARDLFFGPYGHTESYLRADRGADLVVRGIAIDREDDGGPSLAVAVGEADSSAAKALGCRLEVDDLEFGTFAPDVPIVLLRSRDGAPKGLCRLVDPTTSGNGLGGRRPLVMVDDPSRWTVEVKAPAFPNWPWSVRGTRP
jgi:hypothetical protein